MIGNNKSDMNIPRPEKSKGAVAVILDNNKYSFC